MPSTTMEYCIGVRSLELAAITCDGVVVMRRMCFGARRRGIYTPKSIEWRHTPFFYNIWLAPSLSVRCSLLLLCNNAHSSFVF